MKYYLFLIYLIISSNLFGQKQPYNYEVEVKYKMTYQSDSADKKSIQSEFMTLLVGKGQSVFCATQYLIMDSAISAELKKGNRFGPSFSFFQANGTHNSLVIFKDSSLLITFNVGSRFITPAEVYRYTESKSQFKWVILEDTLSLGGILCQKAETNFGNRKWIAWFAPSIPISDGPYKFSGLPGLILKVYDTQNYWNFDLASILNINRVLKINFLNKKPIPLKNKKEYFAAKKYSRDNRFELMKLSGDTFTNPLNFEKKFKENARKDNNWIELYKDDK